MINVLQVNIRPPFLKVEGSKSNTLWCLGYRKSEFSHTSVLLCSTSANKALQKLPRQRGFVCLSSSCSAGHIYSLSANPFKHLQLLQYTLKCCCWHSTALLLCKANEKEKLLTLIVVISQKVLTKIKKKKGAFSRTEKDRACLKLQMWIRALC